MFDEFDLSLNMNNMIHLDKIRAPLTNTLFKLVIIYS